MNKSSERKLINKYPKIFKQYTLPPSQTAMCWGIECGEGWYDLIDSLCCKIQTYIDDREQTLFKVPQIEATQVKQKFGSLRFYYTPYVKELDKFVHDADRRSSSICEECGETKGVSLTKTGWILPLCKKCRDKREDKK